MAHLLTSYVRPAFCPMAFVCLSVAINSTRMYVFLELWMLDKAAARTFVA